MSSWSRRTQLLLAAVPVGLLLLAFLIFPGEGSRTVTAHFDRAVGVYPGTHLRVMGVRVGEVTAVVPEGNSVRVEMTYDSEYKIPADAEAAVITPTLVADRYVQVYPAYSKGAAMKNDGDIPLARTQTPIELDRMFKSLDDLAVTLGPQAGSTKGALDNLLTAGVKALGGNGALGSETIRNLSKAAEVFADNRGPLFENVRSLAEITDTLATNDATVQEFLTQLAGVSEQFAGERDELKAVLESLADVLGSVKGFIKENRATLGKDIDLLASLLQRVDNQKDSVGIVVQKGSLAMSNLALAFEPVTGTYGSRVQVQPGIQFRPDQFLCQTLTNTGTPGMDVVCDLLETLFTPLLPATSGSIAPTSDETATTPDIVSPPTPASKGGKPDLVSLLGGGS
ncbi:phospholipid/cholesterol/gamma-HCH transport system substrate-binding protein [Aeromicrobium panaciterrae]|uniref:Phospholipid/cholesterol/gamma-HCH transport system substrate-binding protein n=1 Tax=Aeromicrobium panaciterrae TaxID=363861 RepID=A0ABU1UJH6_9ACTN|nr:MCE family protein [Aeromicrobium panaciterrae]MDR7085301.1 phospholipid/cholesterol/gamma-HCH transport system substrate-binding protein [Aeromicrobium panaciterrae]